MPTLKTNRKIAPKAYQARQKSRKELLNLRRKGSDAVRPANNRSEIGGIEMLSFALPADAAVLCIL